MGEGSVYHFVAGNTPKFISEEKPAYKDAKNKDALWNLDIGSDQFNS